ncbi:hypothetical protein TVAG_277600 [Trichomonas vaginalis G3]|uniref:DUF3447 domain-containing protein n=1 Tax=Trichomonas vaginalis (strain ATCC PRA-98 / G3) TaxID=412133 RepID=A2FF21_TRIV3|nr:protein ubiquitination [Trichomonas vaginalis G3]EAX96479.1 hypothetical protein TVAG_277600 [Trichomonas vaginalis G3]KAI5552089.1 protein ubiquitination [Trichomonas vaginalis G3]|eukprot:XP_001309409.1 hypothetical protein [Trichomonas vaginalis G3]
MNDDIEKFIAFTEREGFDQNQTLKSYFYPIYHESENPTLVPYSLLELCCYHGAIDCFKFLRTKYNSKITDQCLSFSFLSGNAEIINECLKTRKPDNSTMRYAIISHNIDFVTFLRNECNIEIDLEFCGEYNNLQAFLVYFDQTNDVDKCYLNSPYFNIPSLCEYFLLHGANINLDNKDNQTVILSASKNMSPEIANLIVSKKLAKISLEYSFRTLLHFAAINNSKKLLKFLFRMVLTSMQQIIMD